MTTTTTSQQTKTAKDILGKLKKQPAPSIKPAKTELELTPELDAIFERYGGVKSLFDDVEARLEIEKSFLKDGCFDLYLERFWEYKTQLQNPPIKRDKKGAVAGTVDIEAMYIFTSNLKLQMPQLKENQEPRDALIEEFAERLADKGMQQAREVATRLVDTEIDFTPKTGDTLDRLLNGHSEGDGKTRIWVPASEAEQALGTKVLFLLDCRNVADLKQENLLTDDEMQQVIRPIDRISIRPGFLNRVCGYVNSLDQLKEVFKIIKPNGYVSRCQFGKSDTDAERNNRKFAIAKQILGK